MYNPIRSQHIIEYQTQKPQLKYSPLNPQTQKSVAFLSLAVVIKLSAWIQIQCFNLLVVAVEDGVSNEPTTETTKNNPVQAVDDASTTKDESG